MENSKSAKIGIGFSIIGYFSQFIVGVLPMTQWSIAPIYAQITVVVSCIFMIIGIGLIIASFVKSDKEIKKQKLVIEQYEKSLENLRKDASYLTDITSIVYKMDKILQNEVESHSDIVDEQIKYDVFINWITKINGIFTPIEPPKTKKYLWWIWFCSVMLLVLPKVITKNDNKIRNNLFWLSGEMDEKQIGLNNVKQTNNYQELVNKLDELRGKIGNNENLNKSIERYLLYTYGLNSLNLFLKYFRLSENKYLPRAIKITSYHINQAYSIKVHQLQNDIIKNIELSLIGK